MDRLMALTMRARFDAAVLRKLDGRGLFTLGVDEGMVGKDVLSLEPGAVVVAGDTARIGLVSRGQEVPPESGFRFERERGHWRLDVMSIAPSMATPPEWLASGTWARQDAICHLNVASHSSTG